MDKDSRRAELEKWQQPAVNLVVELFTKRNWAVTQKPMQTALRKKYFWNGASRLEVGPSKFTAWVIREQEHSNPFTISESWETCADEPASLFCLVGWELTEDKVWFIDRAALWNDLAPSINKQIEIHHRQSGDVDPIFLSRTWMNLEPYRENFNLVKKALYL